MKNFSILLSLLLVGGLNVAWAQCSDLFFSEYIEGSGNNKGIEVFNASDNAINLADYRIVEYGNGGSFQDTLDLAPFGMLAAGDVLVLTTDQADPVMLAQADSAFSFPSITHFNGDDALVLLKLSTGDTLDIFGIVGPDPGFWWPVGNGDSTQNITLVRKADVNEGTTDWAVASQQWLAFPSNTFDSLGAHTMAPCGPGPVPSNCTEPFFSEYIEGSGNNKGIEVFNPTDNPIDLSDYRIVENGNGGSFQDTLDLAPFGMLAAGDVLVLTTDQADPVMLAQADSAFSFPSISHFNGDDALILLKLSTGDTLDIFGIVGPDPGFWWPVGSGDSTQNITLVRKADVNEGTSDWAVASQQWLAFPSNTFDSLGTHTMDPCSDPPPVPVDSTNCITEIFFSEYIEGSSNNKALEIFNPMDAAVNLGNYEIHRFTNGTSLVSNIFQLTGMLDGSGVYVIGNSGADSVIISRSDTTGSATFYNGDDALALINTATGDTVDIIGIVGNDPGSFWTVDTGSTQNFTLVRMASVHEGTTDWTLSSMQWMVFPIDTYDSLGVHSMNPCSGCETDIFFSEYIEGSSNNKAIEIFNPADTTVMLDNYTVYRYGNGSPTPTDTLELSGTLVPGEVYIAANDGADPLILAVANDSIGFPGAITFNGDDAMGILNEASGLLVDVIGVIGTDPGSNWPVDTGSTANYTLVRKPDVNEGTTDWNVGSTQWIVLPINTFDSLGTHTMNPCPVVVPTSVAFSPAGASVSESVGSASFSVVINNPTPGDSVAVDVIFNAAASTATLGTDFTWADTTIVFEADSTAPISLSVDIIDDTDIEGDEEIVVDLMNVTNGAIIGTGTFTLTIEDDDFAVYPIGLITADSVGDGLADSLGITCQIQGIVHGIDYFSGTGLQFWLIDSTGGINVFSFSDVDNYVVQEGDELIVIGEIDEFRGLTEMIPSSITLASSGNALVTPLVVTELNETTESELISLECVMLLDTADWPSDSNASSINLSVTNYVDTFTVRIDSDVDLVGTPVPTAKWLNFTGLGTQFDSSFPHLDGYQVLPRYQADLVERPDPTAGFAVAADTANENGGSAMVEIQQTDGNPDTTMVSIELDATNSTATLGTDFTFSDTTVMLTGCGTGSTMLDVPMIDDTDVEGDETAVFVVTTVTNNATVGIDTLTLTINDDETGGIGSLLNKSRIRLYPNPASSRLIVDASLPMERIAVFNLVGQEVLRIDRPNQISELSISALPQGIYTLRVITEEGLWMQQWVKE